MRRIVLSLIVAGSAAMLTACGGGGTAFGGGSNSNSIDRVVITGTGTLSGVNKVVPGGRLLLSAQGVKGPTNTKAGDNGYTWTASYVTVAGTPVQSTETGTQVFCNTVAAGIVFPASAIFVDSTNAAQITLVPPLASPAVTASPAAFTPAAPAGSYCLNVAATHTADFKVGSVVVLVDNAP